MELQQLLSGFKEQLRSLLVEEGFVAYTAVLVVPLQPHVVGCVELLVEANPTENRVEVDVAIGVHHQQVERILADLKGQPYQQYSPFTVGVQIGYLMPGKSHVLYLLHSSSDVARVAEHVAADVRSLGRPFMASSTSLASIAEFMKARPARVPATSVAYRLPIVLHLMGDTKAALECDLHYLEKLASGADVWAAQYRQFGQALKAYLGCK